MQSGAILTPSEIEHFVVHGYVTLHAAFSDASAAAMRDMVWLELAAVGICVDQRSTWSRPLPKLNRSAKHQAFAPIASPRLLGAIDDLVGNGRWQPPPSWGMVKVLLPTQEAPSWDLPRDGWHWDSAPGDLGAALFLLIHFAGNRPGAGGTLFAGGSHRLLERWHESLPPADHARKGKWKLHHFPRSHPWATRLVTGSSSDHERIPDLMHRECIDSRGHRLRVVQAAGGPGDVTLCHPLLYHAATTSWVDEPLFMRIKNLRLSPLHGRDEGDTPLARALRPFAKEDRLTATQWLVETGHP